MSWSASVKVDALVKCQRSCCVCHRFCGTNIELHHVDQGGPEFLDSDIETRRAEFDERLDRAIATIANLTSPSRREGWYNAGIDEGEYSKVREEQVLAGVKKSNELNTAAADAHLELFRLVRRRLGLDLRFD